MCVSGSFIASRLVLLRGGRPLASPHARRTWILRVIGYRGSPRGECPYSQNSGSRRGAGFLLGRAQGEACHKFGSLQVRSQDDDAVFSCFQLGLNRRELSRQPDDRIAVGPVLNAVLARAHSAAQLDDSPFV